MNPGFVLRLRPPGAVFVEGNGDVRLGLGSRTVSFAAIPPSVRAALVQLVDGASCDELSRVADDDTDDALALWYYCLELLQRHGCLTCDVVEAGRPLARVITAPEFQPGHGVVSEVSQWALSRFTYLQCASSGLVMKSACSSAQVELLDPGLARLTTALATPVSVTDALAHRENIGCTAAAEFLGLLEYSGMLTRVERGNRLEDASPLAAWEFVDLLFHNSTRTFVSSQREAPGMRSLPPAVKWPMSADTIDLHVPDIALLEHTDVPLTRVLERRRSGREYGAPIITVEQIGELLYRTARVKKVFAMGERDGRYELTERPYPGAGACYELETYLVVNRCHGLASGLYHYDPLRHRLEAISSDRANLARLNNDAALRTPAAIQRQVLVIIAARFARLAIKYRAGSYGLILKDAGVLLQSMSLVADAMGLASCILGSGDSALFARTAGTQPYEESSVAELLLGSAPPSPAPQSA